VSIASSMSYNTFDENREQIETDVRLLLSDPKRRKLSRLAVLYENSTNELLAEVLSTDFGPVVVFWTSIGRWANQKPRESGQGEPLHLRQYRKKRSVAPLAAESDQVFFVMSRSNTLYSVWASDFVRVITGEFPLGGDNENLIFKRV